MDSFLDQPRTIPKPTPVIQEIGAPTVPEVSLMFQNSRKGKTPIPINFGKSVQSYNAWKLSNNTRHSPEYDSFLLTNATNKENLATASQSDKSFLSKKQVRFESPVQQTSPVSLYPVTRQNVKKVIETSPLAESNSLKYLESQNNNLKVRYNAGHSSPGASDENNIGSPTKNFKSRQMSVNYSPCLVVSNENNTESPTQNFKSRQMSANYSPSFSTNKPTEPAKAISKPFEKLYVSNIPNRELDLSFLEPQKNPCNSIKTQTYTPYKTNSSTLSQKAYDYNDNFKAYTPRFNPINPGLRNELPTKVMQNNISEVIKLPDSELKEKTADTEKQDEIRNEIKSTNNSSTNTEQNEKILDCDVNKVCDNNKELNSNESESKTSTDTVTVSDLLTIIKMQNEQLQILQSQVEKLVKLNEKEAEEKSKKTVENVEQNNKHVIMCRDQQVGTTFEDVTESHQETIEKDGKKISVGLMTSFEVSFKPPLNKKKNKTRILQPVEDESNSSVFEPAEQNYRPAKKQEYARRNRKQIRHNQEHLQQQKHRQQQQRFLQEQHLQQQQHLQKQQEQQQQERMPNQWNYRGTNETEYSLGSQESLEVQEPPESPENSIHIDMQEYDTDSSDDECSTDEGWTFYKDILGQVNHLLENSPRPTYNPRKEVPNRNYDDEHYTDTTLEQIKHATMKRLQTDGFLQANNDQLQIKPTEVSFAVKQILMKYVPDDGLANVAIRNNQEEHYKPDKRKPTDITAFKYIQQCNVVTNAPPYYGRKGKNTMKKPPSRNKLGTTSSDPKVLDITTLKQQPKFL